MTSHSMLVPGSVWERARKKGAPTQSRVVCVSNEDLQPPASENFPPQVIFVTDKLKVLTMPVEAFVASRTYVGIDEHIKALAEALVTAEEVVDDEDEIDFDAVPLPVEEAAPEIVVEAPKKRVQVADLLFGEEAPVEAPVEKAVGNSVTAAQAISQAIDTPLGLTITRGATDLASRLQAAFVGYCESPFPTGDTQHALKFSLADLDLATIHHAFNPETADSVGAFSVTSSYEITNVIIDGYVDTFLNVSNGEGFGMVYVTSAGDFRNKEYEDSKPAVIAPEQPQQQVVVSTQPNDGTNVQHVLVSIPATAEGSMSVTPLPLGMPAPVAPLTVIPNLAQAAPTTIQPAVQVTTA